MRSFNRLLDFLSEYLSQRKGLLPLIGIFFVAINGVIQFIPAAGWFAGTDLLLHIGVILAILGIMLAWAL